MTGTPFRPAAVLASTRRAVRGVLKASRRLWLARSGTAEAVAAFALVLFDRLPGLLVAAAEGLGRHV
jgi:hypothetical protein